LEEVGSAPIVEMIGVEMSEEMVEHNFSEETTKFESVGKWKFKDKGYEGSMGDQVDMPFDQHEEVQQIRLHKESRPTKQLEEMIEEIRSLMLRSTHEVVSKERLNRGKSSTIIGKQQQQ
jgi:hypothetical protein